MVVSIEVEVTGVSEAVTGILSVATGVSEARIGILLSEVAAGDSIAAAGVSALLVTTLLKVSATDISAAMLIGLETIANMLTGVETVTALVGEKAAVVLVESGEEDQPESVCIGV